MMLPPAAPTGPGFSGPPEREGSLLASFGTDAGRAGVPCTAARGWLRRFRRRAPEAGVAFAALAVELGGEAIGPAAGPGRFALAAIGAAFEAACALPGWAGLGVWRFASSVSGGRLIAANAISPFLIVGRRRFMPPIPPLPASGGRRHGPQGARADRTAPLGGDRRGRRRAADRRAAGRAGPADRRAGSPAPGRVAAALLAGHNRSLAAGVAQGRAGGPQALATGRHGRGARPPGAVRRGRRAAAGTARPLGRADRLDLVPPARGQGRRADRPRPAAPRRAAPGGPGRRAEGVRPV